MQNGKRLNRIYFKGGRISDPSFLKVDLLPLKHLPHLKSLHLRVCESSSASIMQIITKHLTGLVALTCPENVDDIEFRNLCKEFSQRQLTRLTVGSATLTNSGLQYISLLTSLKDFSVKNSFLIHDAISSATTNLRRLKIECCSRLKGMNLANFPNLESLVVSKSSGFQLTNARLCTNLTRLKPRYQFGLEEWPIMEMTQLESLEISGSTTQIAKLSLLQNLTKLDLLDQSTSVMPDLVNCTQLKSLQITSALGLSTQMELLLSLPNLENLSLIGLRVEKPTCISSLQRLKVLKIECPNCTAHLDALYLARPCNEIRGIEKLTNLEVLSLKACTHPNLSNLTRLKSLSFRVNCFSQSQPTTVFIDHVAKVPYLALQKFQISGIASKVIQASIVHLIAQQTSLQELTVGTRDKSVNGHNYHTKQLMHFKQLMARPQSDEDDEDESSVSYD